MAGRSRRERDSRQKGDDKREWTRIQVVGFSNGIMFLSVEFIRSILFASILFYPIIFYSFQKYLDYFDEM
jgi:hypothetical protein